MKSIVQRWWLPSINLVLAMLLLSGCTVYQLDQSGMDQNVRPYQQAVPFVTESPIASDWLIPESANGPKVDIIQDPSATYQGTSGLNVLASIVTLFLIPIAETTDHTDTANVVWEGQTLASSSASYAVKSYFSVYFPTPILLTGSTDGFEDLDHEGLAKTIDGIHARNFADAVARQKPFYDKVPKDDPKALIVFLRSTDAPLFKPKATAQIAALAPKDNPLKYHHLYVDLPGYIHELPIEMQALLIGPEGLKGWQIKEALSNGEDKAELISRIVSSYPDDLAAWHRQTRIQNSIYRQHFASDSPVVTNMVRKQSQELARWPHYPYMTNAHRKILIDQGVPAEIVAYMSNAERSAELIAAAKTGALLDARGQTLTEEQLLERLVRNDNNGRFMSPFTSDGVLAEWVNLANNANMGATAGSAVGAVAGAYATNKALDFVPFGLGGIVGGAAGAKVGKEVGRETAISASGGWEAIRASSDQSFNSLNDMARYLKQKYGSTANFADAVRAATQIYPEFSSVLDSTY